MYINCRETGLRMQTHRSDHLIRHSLLLLTASQATNLTNLFFQVFMVRMLSPVEYADLAAMLGLLMIFGMPLAALSNSLAYYSAQMIEEGRPGAVKPFMRHWLKNIFLIASGIILLGIILWPAATSFFNLQGSATFMLAIIVMGISLYGSVIGGILQGIQAFVWSTVSSVSGGIFRLGVGVLLVCWLGQIADWGIIAHGIGMLVSVLIAVGAVAWIFRGVAKDAIDKKVTAYFVGSMIVLAGFSVMMSADVLIVKHFFSSEESGLFAQVAVISHALVFLPMPIAGALFPKIIAVGDADLRHKRMLLRGTVFAGLIIVFAAGGCSLVPQLPLWIVHVPPSESMVTLLRCMLWAMSPLSLAYIVMNYHLARSRFKILFLLPVCALLYLAGAAIWHASVFQIIAVMAACNLTGLAVLLIGLPWRGLKPAESGAAPAVKCVGQT